MLVEQRSRYRDAALQLAKLKSIPASSKIRSELDSLLSKLKLSYSPNPVRLLPASNNESYRFESPLQLDLTFKGEPLPDVPLRLKFASRKRELEQLNTISTSGSIFSVTGSSPTSFSATDHAEPILRLPAKLHKTYAVEVQSQKTINEICIAESMDELRGI